MKEFTKQRIFSVVGHSGSGKTTLVGKLVLHYKSMGISAGVIKHTRHEIKAGDEGKDTDLFKRVGASGCIITDGKDLLLTSAVDGSGPESLAHRYFSGSEIVIVEGWKESEGPKLEVVGDSSEPPLFLRGITGIKFVVSDRAIETDLPVYGTSDLPAIVAAIEKYLL